LEDLLSCLPVDAWFNPYNGARAKWQILTSVAASLSTKPGDTVASATIKVHSPSNGNKKILAANLLVYLYETHQIEQVRA
jgi:hypothetical protein